MWSFIERLNDSNEQIMQRAWRFLLFSLSPYCARYLRNTNDDALIRTRTGRMTNIMIWRLSWRFFQLNFADQLVDSMLHSQALHKLREKFPSMTTRYNYLSYRHSSTGTTHCKSPLSVDDREDFSRLHSSPSIVNLNSDKRLTSLLILLLLL